MGLRTALQLDAHQNSGRHHGTQLVEVEGDMVTLAEHQSTVVLMEFDEICGSLWGLRCTI